MKRPRYVPWMWVGARNRRLWGRPEKVLRSLLWQIPVGAVFAYLAWIEEDPRLRNALLAAAAVIVLQVVWYAPRAWRAKRRS